ncbi:MAG: alpha/beta hydrolase domain-containing protein [Acidobacteriota bacterium]|nr:alpha/beta hydrolase domain-containing protein [Acidobacteriota bacterium]
MTKHTHLGTRRSTWLVGALGAVLCSLGATAADAELVRFEILRIESPTFEGVSFGSSGLYEKIVARAFLEVDPHDRRNTDIIDLGLTPTNASGRVEFVTDVMILKPIDLDISNHRMLYGVVNRGRKLSLGLLNDAPRVNDPTTATDTGNGYVMRQGYTLVWSGWQADVTPGEARMRVDVPTVNGVTGSNQDEFIFEHNDNPTVVTLSYPAASLNPDLATLTVRQHERDPRVTPADLSFEFIDGNETDAGSNGATRVRIHRPTGFDAGAIYELTYPARDPLVMGLGFAATRDVVAFLRRETTDSTGRPNPLAPNGAPAIAHAYALGISQSGRFLRDLVYQGFNEDEDGQLVFDGVIPHVAGSRKTFVNTRWAQPGRYSREHETHLTPGDQFPFTYGVLTDPLTGLEGGILARCQQTETCPKVMHTDTSTELWQARSSLVVTDTAGADIELPSNVRAYLLGSAPHGGAIDGVARMTPTCQHLRNPVHAGPTMRALLHALDQWQSHDVAPPDTRYPSRAAGTLVLPDRDHTNFPAIPGLGYTGRHNGIRVTDYGQEPPAESAAYPVYVSRIDADGNDVAGIRLPAVQAPLGTYLGWNQRRTGHAEGALCSTTGSFIPFAKTRAERQTAGDARLSLEERYPSRHAYTERVHDAVTQLRDERLLLTEDADQILDHLTADAPRR